MLNKKMVLLVLLLFMSILSVSLVAKYYLSTAVLVVNYKNVSNVTLVNRDTKEEVGVYKRPGDDLRVWKDSKYDVIFSGNRGYNDGLVAVKDFHKPVIINPTYSKDKLQSLLNSELPIVRATIQNYYPKVNSLYSVSKGELYNFGEWYGTTLIYRGGYSQSSDTLRIILHKTGDTWQVAAQPDIILSSNAYPAIPFDILDDVNQQPNS